MSGVLAVARLVAILLALACLSPFMLIGGIAGFVWIGLRAGFLGTLDLDAEAAKSHHVYRVAISMPNTDEQP